MRELKCTAAGNFLILSYLIPMATILNAHPQDGRRFTLESLDHVVLTVRNVERTMGFYTQVLGMERLSNRALKFGNSRINLHELGGGVYPRAALPTPGSGDLCFITRTNINDVIRQLQANQVPIVAGPFNVPGAIGTLRSVYIRDPDQNLIEISNRQEHSSL